MGFSLKPRASFHRKHISALKLSVRARHLSNRKERHPGSVKLNFKELEIQWPSVERRN